MGSLSIFVGRNARNKVLEMTQIYLKNIKIIDSGSEWHGKKAYVHIKDGKIESVSPIPLDIKNAVEVEGENLYVSQGWIDLRANFCDPGFEYKEDILSGLESAAYGGFTGVAILPETDPALVSKSSIEYVLRKAEGNVVNLYPLASISSSRENESLTEMFDVQEAGARGFSSGYKPVKDSGFLLRAMEYAGMTKLPLMVRPENPGIAGKGLVNEGVVSVRLGLKGIPSIAEESDINKILHLCEYTGQPIHLSCVSTKGGMAAIEKAHKEGLKVTADVSIHHLYYDEEDLGMFDTRLKLRPPLRTAEDKEYLRQAVLNNDFVAVVSDHTPHEEDRKQCEFELAGYGATGLQTVFSQLLHIFGNDKIDKIVEILTVRPGKIMNLTPNPITKDSIANLTIFDSSKSWTLNDETNKSKSKNSPLWEKELKGKAIAVVNNGHVKNLN